jgi:phosphoglycerate dehydrogenase-like enzyme
VFWEEPIRRDDPLLALPNVIATPHVAGVTDNSYREIADAVAANIDRFRRGEKLLNQVDSQPRMETSQIGPTA